MKPKKHLFKKMTLGFILGVVAIANVFGIGFASFLYKGPSSGLIGDINVTVGDIAMISVRKTEPNSVDGVSGFTVGYNGFNNSNQKTAKISLYFDLYLNTQSYFNLNFSILQKDTTSEYPNFDFTKYIDKMTLTAKIRNVDNKATHNIASSDRGNKTLNNTFSTREVKASGKGLTIPMTIDLLINASSASDFAKDVYLPLLKNDVKFDLGIDIYA